jgi:glycosyltransferase involved in cell wall biosynthesis
MKVLMVISQFSPIIGGSEKQAQLLAKTLIGRGIHVDICTGWWNFGIPRKEVIDGIKVFRNFSCWKMFGIKGIRTLGVFIYMVSLGIYLILHRKEYDIIHVHQVLYSAFVSVLIGKKFLKKAVLVKYACSGLTSDIKHLKRFPLGGHQLKYLIENMDCLVTVNLEGKSEFKAIGYPESKILYVPNGVAVPVESKINYGRVAQVLTIGRLDKQKGIDVLLKVWAMVAAEEKILKLIILGNGPQEMKLKRLSKSLKVGHSVQFKGVVHNVEEYLRDSDLFVLPSRAEGLSNVLLEAMSYGIPCIATHVGGTPELFGVDRNMKISPGEYRIAGNGVLVNPDDVEGLSRAMLYLIRNGMKREELGNQARLSIQENYSIDLIADKYIGLYQHMLHRTS